MFHGSEHDWVRENLSPYIDDRLATDERHQVEEHLAQCAPCQEELASLRATVALLQRVPETMPRRSFVVVAPEPRRLSPAFAFFRLATALAALLLVVVLSGDVLEGLGYLPTPSPPAAMAPSQADESPEAIPSAEGPEEMGVAKEGAELPDRLDAPTPPTVAKAPEEPRATPPEAKVVAMPPEAVELLPWRLLELGLGVLVVVLGGTTLWLAWRS